MSRKKRKKPHKCKNHPQLTARGRCVQCGQWVCHTCALLRQGKFFCADTCGGEQKADIAQVMPEKEIEADTAPVSHSGPTHGLSLWSAATLGMCILVFALLQMRENRALKDRLAKLEERQVHMAGYVKRTRERVEGVSRDSLADSVRTQSRSAAKKAGPPPRYNSVKSPYGVPFSFNNGTTAKKLVALTFDGGAHANAAPDILDTLRSRNVKATMFFTGTFIRYNTTLVRRIVDEHHLVGNHTLAHPHLTSWAESHTHTTLPKITEEFLADQLSKANKLMRDKTGQDFYPIWRAPYGEMNNQLCLWGQNAGYVHIGWRQGRTWRQNLDSNDWVPDEDTPGYHSPDDVYGKIMGLAKQQPYGINGGIILLHLGTTRKDTDKQVHRILGKIIDDLREEGYQFVTLDVLLKESGVDISNLPKTVVSTTKNGESRS